MKPAKTPRTISRHVSAFPPHAYLRGRALRPFFGLNATREFRMSAVLDVESIWVLMSAPECKAWTTPVFKI